MPSTPPAHTLLSRRTLVGHGARAGALLAAAIVPIAGFLGLAVSGCGSTQSTQTSQPPEAANHAAHDAAGGAVQTVLYRAGEGFVPARLDVETGTRVVLVDESGEQLAPRFGVAQADSHSGGETDDHGAQGAHSPGHHSDAPAWTSDDPHGDDHSPDWAHAFDVSGYWRYHNDLNPSHTGLIVALPPAGTKLEPLVVEGEALSFPETPALTHDEYRELLQDTEAVREFMKAHGPHNTLKVLRQAEVETGLDCHQSAHHLGRMAFAEYGAAASVSVEEACQSGMRHGMMEQLFVTRGITNLADDVDVLCPSEDDYFSRHQCLHGVGHGVMAWTAYEIEDALQLCDLLSGEASQRSCYTGIFMENVVSGLSAEVGQSSAYVDRNDPHYPCNTLDQRYVDDCYWYQTSQMMVVFNRDLTLVVQACEEAPPGARRACFGSYGRDVSGLHRRSPLMVAHFCGLAPNVQYRGDCIDGAARTLFWEESQQDEGLALCAAVEDPLLAESCYESIVGQAHMVVADLGPFCAKVPDRWRDWCRRR